MSIKLKYIIFIIVIFIIVATVFKCNNDKYVNDNNELIETKETNNKKESKHFISDESPKVVEITEITNLGEFKLTAYCPCSICCGKWSGSPTASGVMPIANYTIAVDTNVIPFGTEVIINNKRYKAEDTGSAIKGKRIDIYFEDHQEALEFGVQYADVFQLGKQSK